MGDENTSLVITAYKGKDTADDVYKTLRALEKEGNIDIKTAATVHRKNNGKLKLSHKHRVTAVKGAFGGGALGLVLAGLTGAAGGVVLGGAVIGALIGSNRSKDRKEAKSYLEDKLGPDDSAIVLLINGAAWAYVQEKVDHFGGDDLVVELTPGAEAQIAAIAEDEDVAAAVADEVEVVEVEE
jgi:uncharacterized membrane protein